MPNSSSQPARSLLAQILVTESLAEHAHRPPDYAAENLALVRLAAALSDSPREILSILAQSALELCDAGSAGISILDPDNAAEFRWLALAGEWLPYVGTVMPRNFSPCGVVLEANAMQLMRQPLRYFPYVAQLQPACEEVLLEPFYLGGVPVGTIWVVKHDPLQSFDAEDARILHSLGTFTSAAYRVLKSIESLEVRAQERGTENAELTTAARSTDVFIATIAHELRNPLGPILNASEVLKSGAADLGMLRRASELIVGQVRTMARLIDDLLDVSRVRLRTMELKPIEVELSAILHAALDASILASAQSLHELKIIAIESPLRAIADPMRLTQVLQNLFDNAAKYTDPAGCVSVALKRENSTAVITISDTGIGIAAEQLGSIFELFAQADQGGTPRSKGGLGIGLHLARQLMHAHGGSLTASSGGVGLGSTFTIRLSCLPD